MAFFTSRYTNAEVANGLYYRVGISVGVPKFRLNYKIDEQCYMFAPTGAMLRMTDDQYVDAYRRKLETSGIGKIRWMLNKLQENAAGKDVVLLCYEDIRDPDQWCHRTLLAEWVRENIGISMEELADPGQIKYKNPARAKQKQEEEVKAQFEQLTLFG